jgi:PKD repeat protein
MIVVGGNGICTGAMVGNTSLDGTPYFLTANHCYSANVASWVFRFNWESPTCTPNQNAPTNQTVSGSVLRAKASASDFCLLQLNSQPNDAYQVYYAGWSKVDVAATSGVGIHHPDGDIKKISFYSTPLQSSGYYTSGSNHWYVQWSSAVTEPGSSGSPLFDQNHRIVGQLHGGNSGCTSNDQSDYYGKFSTSWNGSDASSRLRDWLDPTNTNASFIDGYFTFTPTNTLDVNLVAVSNPVQYFCAGDSIEPKILLKNEGQNAITSAIIEYSINGGSVTTYNWSGNLPLFQQVSITLPKFLIPAGSHTFNCSITGVNGNADQNMSNNSKSTNFQVVNGSKVIIELKTDNYPSETSYLLKNAAGDTLLYQTGFTSANTVYSKEICLEQACYTLTVYDTYGDGLCCTQGNGYIKVLSESGSVLAQAAQFTTSNVMNFCIFTQAPTAAINNTIVEACQGTQISFTHNSQNYSSITWKLSGPANGSSNAATYSYTFNLAGVYILKLFAANNIATDSVVQIITINPKPTLTLSATPASSSTAADGFISVSVNSGTAPYTYLWNNGATTQSLLNVAAGTYTLTVTDSKGCTSSKSAIVTAPSSINQLTGEDGISVFPNPTTGMAQVNWNRFFTVINIDVMNALGQRIKTYHFENTDNGTVDLTTLPPGMYFVQINIGNKIITKKIIIER